MYCYDVQRAFDKVDAELLIYKLASLFLDSCILAVVGSWLRECSAFVIVKGKRSRPIGLRNIVFPGTVGEPTLRNAFFGNRVFSSELTVSTLLCMQMT